MNQDINYLQKPFITVGAVFENEIYINDILNNNNKDCSHQGFCYTFKAEIDSGLQVGDYAVVHARNQLQIVKIVEIHQVPNIDKNATFEYKWVIQKIDFDNFKNRQNEQKKLAVLLTALSNAEYKQSLLDKLNSLASKDETVKQLIKQLLDD